MIGHLLNRDLQQWRRLDTDTEGGGTVTEWTHIGDVHTRVPQPSASERTAAQQAGAELTRPVYTRPGEAVYRGDELRDPATGEVFRVVAAFQPSEDTYLRLDTEYVQPEPAEEPS